MSLTVVPASPIRELTNFTSVIKPISKNIDDVKKALFDQVSDQVSELYPQYQELKTNLNAFQEAVFFRANAFQARNVKVEDMPTESDLKVELDNKVGKYWAFKEKLEKINIFCTFLERVRDVIAPICLSTAETQRLTNDHPEFLALLKNANQTGQQRIEVLNKELNKFTELKNEMQTTFIEKFNCLTEFCQIVENKGQPIQPGLFGLLSKSRKAVPDLSKAEQKVSEELNDPLLKSEGQIVSGACEKVSVFFKTILPNLTEIKEKLEIYRANIRTRSRDLNHEDAVVPKHDVLVQEGNEYLSRYWEFKKELDATAYWFSSVEQLQKMTAPILTATHAYTLGTNHLNLLGQMKLVDELSQSKMVELGNFASEVKSLDGEMRTKIVGQKGKIDHELLRYVQIVQQKGDPLGRRQRISNWLYAVAGYTEIPKEIVIQKEEKTNPQ